MDQNTLDEALRMERKSLYRAIPPLWFNYAIAILTGIFFVSVVLFGRMGLAITPLMLLLCAIQFLKSGVWPYFYRPTRDVLEELKGQLISRKFLNAFILVGTFACPFLLIKIMELRDAGYNYAPYLGGAITAIFVFVTAESSRKYYLKRYGGLK